MDGDSYVGIDDGDKDESEDEDEDVDDDDKTEIYYRLHNISGNKHSSRKSYIYMYQYSDGMYIVIQMCLPRWNMMTVLPRLPLLVSWWRNAQHACLMHHKNTHD